MSDVRDQKASDSTVTWASRPSAGVAALEFSGETPKPHENLYQLAARLKQRGRELGFDLVGICDASPSKHRDYFREWLDDGQAGTMEYLSRRFDERTDPATYFPGARSVICVAMNYHTP